MGFGLIHNTTSISKSLLYIYGAQCIQGVE